MYGHQFEEQLQAQAWMVPRRDSRKPPFPEPFWQESPVGKPIKEFTIYLPTNAAVTIVRREEKPEVEEQDDHYDDELQQMLDDYD
jgi:hypothetical protein